MVDIVDRETRSRMMAGIRSHNTKPEMLIRQQLHACGFRYTLRGAGLPGRPDIVMSRWKVAVFIHGCFWHWHGCALSKMPTTNVPFWTKKLYGNKFRDEVALLTLISGGWRVAIVWECALRGKAAHSELPYLTRQLDNWIRRQPTVPMLEIPEPQQFTKIQCTN